MLSNNTTVINGMVRTKDSIGMKDSYSPIDEYKGYEITDHEYEIAVIDKNRNIVAYFPYRGNKQYDQAIAKAKQWIDQHPVKDSKTKDGEEQTIGNYEGYKLVFKNGFVRAQEDGFTKFEVLSSMGNGGWTQADVKKLMNKIDARRSGMNDSYTQWRIVKSKNGKVIEEKSFQTSGDDSESFVKWREEKQKNSGLGNKLEMYQGNQLVATTDAEFEESKHKRDNSGKFSSSGGGGAKGESARQAEQRAKGGSKPDYEKKELARKVKISAMKQFRKAEEAMHEKYRPLIDEEYRKVERKKLKYDDFVKWREKNVYAKQRKELAPHIKKYQEAVKPYMSEQEFKEVKERADKWLKSESKDSDNNVVIISSQDMARYNELKAMGYVTLWTGEGKIAMAPRRTKDASSDEYIVNIGNIGNIVCASEQEALKTFNEYVRQSKSTSGRAAGEDVVLFKNGYPIKDFVGSRTLSGEDAMSVNEYQTKVQELRDQAKKAREEGNMARFNEIAAEITKLVEENK